MAEKTVSVAQARIQLYPIITAFESGAESVVKIKSRSGSGAVLISAEKYAELTGASA